MNSRKAFREQGLPRAGAALIALSLAGLAGCGGLATGSGIAVPTPDVPPPDGLLSTPDLQAVVDLELARNGSALQALLADPDEGIRARAALGLASVQDATALEALETALSDPSPRVRGNAAFAIGQLSLRDRDGGQLLMGRLTEEPDASVRERLVEAIGKRGGVEAVEGLLAWRPAAAEEASWTLALARAALREVRPTGLTEALVDRLTAPNEAVRRNAAYYFGQAMNANAWSELAPRIRAVLDGYSTSESAAMDLVTALGRLSEVEEDGGRMAHWITAATDWRVRTNAASAVMTPRWLESPEIRDALVAALDDPSGHVRVTAASTIALLMWSSPEFLQRGEEWIEGRSEDWRQQVPFLPPIAAEGSGEAVVAWTRRMASEQPIAAADGVQALGGLTGPEVTELLFDLGESPEPLVRAAAVSSLSQRWARGALDPESAPRLYDLFVRRLADSENLPAARAASALSDPAFQALGAERVLEDAYRSRARDEDLNILVPILESMGPSSIPLLRSMLESEDLRLRAAASVSLRRLTGEEVAIAGDGSTNPFRSVDWPALAELGPRPRVRIETERGEILVRLFADQAPLTVQAFVEEAEAGLFDGTRFHRVVPNFVVQGGDFGMGDGTGSPASRLRSELTQLPFQRGVLGMASAGKDTEGSQFYITHSMEPHLDGGYTAFGWVERGGDVLDRIQQGDLVFSIRLAD